MTMDSKTPLQEQLEALGDLDIREKLDAIGAIREKHDADETELMDAIRTLLPEVEAEGISIAEAARRLHLHRTTIYRVYKTGS